MEERRATTSRSGQTKTPPQLSCEGCVRIVVPTATITVLTLPQKARKVKCDKLDPCTNCSSSGTTCVPIYRMRLPRGRHARPRNNSDARSTISVEEDVNERLRRLEALVDTKGGSAAGELSSTESKEGSVERGEGQLVDQQHRGSRRHGPGRHQHHEFWTNLVDEVSRVGERCLELCLTIFDRLSRQSSARS